MNVTYPTPNKIVNFARGAHAHTHAIAWTHEQPNPQVTAPSRCIFGMCSRTRLGASMTASAFEHTFIDAFPTLGHEAAPQISDRAQVAWVNDELASDLGVHEQLVGADAGLAFLTGKTLHARPRALAYSGYQFGQLSPVLGDGRAHLLGEWIPSACTKVPNALAGCRIDLHLKGSGTTPYSRPGSDGKAPLGAVWREAVIGEALHALGIPTTRALAVISTGETIRRRSPEPEPAAILVRVASSHLRVGTFQYAQLHCDAALREQLVNYALARHFPHVQPRAQERPALTLLRAVAMRQADLVAQWMGVGFVHGVLNTDNVGIPGESIDFGPCAFVDRFEHAAVFSSIDEQGRYSYRNQPGITQWNLARFAETLLDLMNLGDPNSAVEDATAALHDFERRYREAWTSVFAAKLGIRMREEASLTAELTAEAACTDGAVPESASTYARIREFIERTLTLLEDDALDFTLFFRTLTDNPEKLRDMTRMAGTADTWLAELRDLRDNTETDPEHAHALMTAANPVYIPRNHHLEAALRAVEQGDAQPIMRLLDAIRDPYTRRPELEGLETAPPQARSFTSFCGT